MIGLVLPVFRPASQKDTKYREATYVSVVPREASDIRNRTGILAHVEVNFFIGVYCLTRSPRTPNALSGYSTLIPPGARQLL